MQLNPSNQELLQIEYLATAATGQNMVKHQGKDVIEGLTKTPKSLPSKYFYDQQGSQLFEAICQLPEYYPTRTEAAILQEYAQEIVAYTGACELIELGSGSSTKTRLLLDAYYHQQKSSKYLPIDVSETILKASAIELQKEYPNLPIQGLIGTYEQALAYCQNPSYKTRMIFFLGSSIGNFSASECDKFLEKIATVLKAGDYFLLGIDLQKPVAILEAAYNDAQGVTAAFNLNMLSHLNWRFQADFNLDLFSHQAIYNQDQSQIEMYLICQKTHSVHLKKLDLTVNFQASESILTEISRKFNLETMEKDLESKGLKPLKVFSDTENFFGLILCQLSL
ncbi:L-histidine N(alpha)-methyltransferase [Microcystis aeruginosa]|uniref:L-histidine N(alpha)-methyltransferase n=1 Tax=Microcystis aeruginosa TaxID=1126 RepID=UPI001230CD4F|nr:L-histidine N(alpha)-methyltransferase [Microcystis aeruginosa]GCA85197.1 histidine N-alpha-methyltransferase [Microcystis aeruginosa NIES-2522]GCA89724.1 histidine N-alpha-methyltransferase [Microcystis aeruginosa NIES-4264]